MESTAPIFLVFVGKRERDVRQNELTKERVVWPPSNPMRGVRKAAMADDPDYRSLSKRFESFAERAADPLLSESYRKLAQTYRALNYWHEKFKQRYESIAERRETGRKDGDAT
jgi:hypothetical protein